MPDRGEAVFPADLLAFGLVAARVGNGHLVDPALEPSDLDRDLGLLYFKRYFFPQADKEAIIVDERFNGGGSLADHYIDFLRSELGQIHW